MLPPGDPNTASEVCADHLALLWRGPRRRLLSEQDCQSLYQNSSDLRLRDTINVINVLRDVES